VSQYKPYKKHLIAVIAFFLLHAIVLAAEQSAADWANIDVALYNKFKSQGSEEPEIFQAIAYAHFYNENWSRAESYFKKAAQLDPNLYWSWYNLGLINIHTEEGFGYFKQAALANPEFPTPYYWMAYYRCRIREDNKAIPLFEQYLEIAKGKHEDSEQARIAMAEEVLADLLAGREGHSLSVMREKSSQSDFSKLSQRKNRDSPQQNQK
jgi:tetratricopeptide (TPR) repeat protein